jgi:hypothetical protein
LLLLDALDSIDPVTLELLDDRGKNDDEDDSSLATKELPESSSPQATKIKVENKTMQNRRFILTP